MVQVYSQNGWPAYDHTRNFTRCEASGFALWAANDDVAVIFCDIIEWFNENIEPLAQKLLDDWSYANRLVRGSTSVVSNHGSATAIDLNAVRHPRGVRNTFANSDVKKIHEKLKEYDGVIRWGGDYTGTVDDMHFEINKGKAATKAVADRIREKNVFTKEDKAEIRKIFIDVLKTEKVVPNKPTAKQLAADPKAPTTFFSVVSALANIETDQDNDRDAAA
jgi:sporulation protein YlmC with PRC-barrel domain